MERTLLAALALALALTSGTGAPVAAQGASDGSIGGLRSKFIDVGGVKTRYYEEGQGEPMLLLHGGSTAGSSTANVWTRNIPGLAKRFHVYAVDRLGSGLTGNAPDNDYGTEAQARFAYQFIQALKLGPVHLVGHSAGGGVALAMAAEHPEAFTTLVIIAHGAGGGAGRSVDNPARLTVALQSCPDQNVYEGLKCRVEKLGWKADTFDPEYWQADQFMATLPKSRDARAAIVAQAGDTARAARAAAYRDRIIGLVRNDGVLKMPVLLYLGKNDVIDWDVREPAASLKSQMAMLDVLSAKSKDVQSIILNDSGHFMYREHPDLFNRDLVTFVEASKGQAPKAAPRPRSPKAGRDGSIGGLKAKFVDLKGIKARYYDEGKGEPLLLIHGGSTGGSSSANVWTRNIAALATRFRVLAIDRPGSGLSGSSPTNDYDTPAQVEFASRFIEALKLGPVHAVGHSGGGSVVLSLALEHPEQVKTLTVMAYGASSGRTNDDPSRLMAALKKCPSQDVYEGLRCRVEALAWHPDTFDAEYWTADALMATLPSARAVRTAVAAAAADPARTARNAAYREKTLDRIRGGAIQVPVLMYLGKNDVIDWGIDEPVASLKIQKSMFEIVAAKNRRAKLVILNDSGHFMYREHVDRFNRDLTGFIDHWREHPDAVTPMAPRANPDGSVGGLVAKFTAVNGVRTRYFEYGQGEPMVLVHGGSTAGANVWSRNIPGLSARFHVFAMDRLGSGMTARPADGKYDNPAQVAFITEFIRGLKLGPVHLVGHSAGGAIAFYTAVEHPELVKTLTVVAHGPSMLRPGEGPTMLQPALDKCPDQSTWEGRKCRVAALGFDADTFDDEFWTADEYMVNLPDSPSRARVAGSTNEAETSAYRQRAWDRARATGAPQVPILMYGGKQDVLDWNMKEKMASLFGELDFFEIVGAKNPRVKMTIVNKGGHFMYREHPEQFNQDLAAFIAFWKDNPGAR
jgi:2-hydroxy-6-oxonona-2,4-dienedioate hydrolase